MGYLPQFKTDLFVSYRHVSNETEDKWVDAFCEALGKSLTELVGAVTIWRDTPALHTGDMWPKEIAEAINSAAIFLAVICRTYFESDECRKEFDAFLGHIKNAETGGQRRIVPVLKQPPKSNDDLPPELGDIHSHQFFDWDPPGSGRFRELGPNTEKEKFWETLAWLAQDLMFVLEKLKGNDNTKKLGKVFVATVASELRADRDRLRSDLKQRGFDVVPEHEYLWNAGNFTERLVADIEASVLCIHLVLQTESIDPKVAERSRLQLQRATEIAREKGKAPPLVWMQPAPAVHMSAQGLVDFIRNDLANQGVEYSEGGLEDFKTQIYDRMPRMPQPNAASGGDVALLVEEGDCENEPLSMLACKLRFEPCRVQFRGAIPRDPRELATALSRCRQCVILWGGQSEAWVRDLLAMDSLAAHLGEEKLCVYATGPATPEKRSFLSLKARVVRAIDGPQESELRRFFDKGPSAL